MDFRFQHFIQCNQLLSCQEMCPYVCFTIKEKASCRFKLNIKEELLDWVKSSLELHFESLKSQLQHVSIFYLNSYVFKSQSR